MNKWKLPTRKAITGENNKTTFKALAKEIATRPKKKSSIDVSASEAETESKRTAEYEEEEEEEQETNQNSESENEDETKEISTSVHENFQRHHGSIGSGSYADSEYYPSSTSKGSSLKDISSKGLNSTGIPSSAAAKLSSLASHKIKSSPTMKSSHPSSTGVIKPQVQIEKFYFGWPANYPLPMHQRLDLRVSSTRKHNYCNVDLRAFPTSEWDPRKPALYTTHTDPPGIDGSFLYIGAANSRPRHENYASTTRTRRNRKSSRQMSRSIQMSHESK